MVSIIILFLDVQASRERTSRRSCGPVHSSELAAVAAFTEASPYHLV
jgi:hypothetical protein